MPTGASKIADPQNTLLERNVIIVEDNVLAHRLGYADVAVDISEDINHRVIRLALVLFDEGANAMARFEGVDISGVTNIATANAASERRHPAPPCSFANPQAGLGGEENGATPFPRNDERGRPVFSPKAGSILDPTTGATPTQQTRIMPAHNMQG